MRYDLPAVERVEEIRAVTVSWSRALWVGFWFAWGMFLAGALPAIGLAFVIAAAVT